MNNSIIAAAIAIVVMSANPAIAQNTTASPTASPRPTANAPAPIPVSDVRADANTPDLTESRANSDARVCLEFPTKMQIIKCSEKYRGTHVRHTGT
jgi:hypothetical protein